MRKQSTESPVVPSTATPAADIGKDASHLTRGEPYGSTITMQYTDYQPTPVYSSDGFPLMPCHPARARKLLRNGRAVPHHTRGIFGIRLLDRTRAQSEVQDPGLRIDPGSITTGIAVTNDDDDEQRTVLAAVEIKHRAGIIKATMTQRRQHRRNRRGRLRYRATRFNNRKRKPGTLPPSVDSLRVDTMRVVKTLLKMYPVASISIEYNKFDPRLMQNPDIKGVEYQHGTLFGWHIRAYVLERDQGRCVYCKRSNVKLELGHVRPRAVGSDRVDNLVACCRDCNIAKDNQHIEQLLKDQPKLLTSILERLQSSDLAHAAHAAHVNAALPAIVRDLLTLGLPIQYADAALVSWARHQLGVAKTHCYDAALQGNDFTSIVSLPGKVLELRPSNGKSKQKANVDKHGTPVGQPFRDQQRLPRHLLRRNPAPGHSDRRQRHGPQLIGTGDTVRMESIHGTVVARVKTTHKGTGLMTTDTNPRVSAPMRKCSLVARNPRHKLRWTTPSQQQHHEPAEQTANTNIVA